VPTLANPGREQVSVSRRDDGIHVTPPCHPGEVEQLALLDPAAGAAAAEHREGSWQLDERTRAVGRVGLEQARRALSGSAVLAGSRPSEREAA
jgi:hypothetical protein